MNGYLFFYKMSINDDSENVLFYFINRVVLLICRGIEIFSVMVIIFFLWFFFKM